MRAIKEEIKMKQFIKKWSDPDNSFNDEKYQSGRICIEEGCNETAGTFWSSLYCFSCNAKRMTRINLSFMKFAQKNN